MNKFKLRFELDIPAEGFFFDKGYKTVLHDEFQNLLGSENYVFSDIVPRIKKVTEDGFWAVKGSMFDCFIYNQEKAIDIAQIMDRHTLKFRYGGLGFRRVRFVRVQPFRAGYTLSSIIALDEGFYPVDYNMTPDEFSDTLRTVLIQKYEKIYGNYPLDDRFIFIFNGVPDKENIGDYIGYRGKFEMYGSNELISIACTFGLGSLNEMGQGMISDSLYFWNRGS